MKEPSEIGEKLAELECELDFINIELEPHKADSVRQDYLVDRMIELDAQIEILRWVLED